MTYHKRQKSNPSGKYRAGIERSKKEEQEFGPGKKDFKICSDCDAVYYYKSWHHNLQNYNEINEDKAVSFSLCPACKMIKEKRFEGQVVFENVPDEFVSGIVRNIKNTGERAQKRDPMDRIIKIKNQKSKIKNFRSVEVLTTENQLARNVARQVEKAFKGFGKDIKWSKEESPVRITMRF